MLDVAATLTRVPIRTRLLGGFLTVLFVAGAIAMLALENLAAVGAVATRLAEDDIHAVVILSETRQHLLQIERHLSHLLLHQADSAWHVAELDAADRAMLTAIRTLATSTREPREAAVFGELAARYAALGETSALVRQHVSDGDDRAALALLRGRWQDVHADAVAVVDRLHAARTATLQRAAATARVRTATGRTVVVVTTLAGIGLCMLLATAITRSITTPIGSLVAASERAILGEFEHKRVRAGGDEIGRLAQRFDEMMAAVRGAFEQQRRFFADASHEMRTPVTIIRGEAEVALRGPETAADYREALQIILGVAQRMARLIDDFLFLARSSAGQLTHRMAPVALTPLLRQVEIESRALAADKGVTLKLECGEELVVSGDAARLVQLFMILVDNGIKYTARHGVVHVTVRSFAGDALVVVTDTGPGIAAEDLPRIFDRFYRGRGQAARSPDGTGLGLAIAKAIAEAHGGGIAVESVETAGSAFTVTLPIAAG